MQRQDDSDPECKVTADAYLASTYHATTGGYYLRITGDVTVMRLIREYGQYCVEANTYGRCDDAELAAAQAVITRANEALSALQKHTSDGSE